MRLRVLVAALMMIGASLGVAQDPARAFRDSRTNAWPESVEQRLKALEGRPAAAKPTDHKASAQITVDGKYSPQHVTRTLTTSTTTSQTQTTQPACYWVKVCAAPVVNSCAESCCKAKKVKCKKVPAWPQHRIWGSPTAKPIMAPVPTMHEPARPLANRVRSSHFLWRDDVESRTPGWVPGHGWIGGAALGQHEIILREPEHAVATRSVYQQRRPRAWAGVRFYGRWR